MTSDELRALLKEYGIDPLKARGQHFLADVSVIHDAVAAADVRPGDAVLEIGPGPGVLTEALLDAGASVVAVDLDRRFAPLLEKRFSEKGRDFTFLLGDALSFSNAELTEKFSGKPYKVVANIPYGITSAIVAKCLTEEPAPTSATLLIQREVAERIVAKPGDMSRLAVLVQTYAQARIVRTVSAGAFLPPPKVESAVIHIARKSEAELRDFFGSTDPKTYFSIVSMAFAAPRKQLKNTLATRFSEVSGGVEEALMAADVPSRARPEELSVEAWKKLAESLTA